MMMIFDDDNDDDVSQLSLPSLQGW